MDRIHSKDSSGGRKKKCVPSSAGPAGGPTAPVRALYVHVPFCVRKCRYCDFYSLPFRPEQAGAFVRAAAKELSARRGCLAAPLRSVFVGGGTPTALGERLLDKLLAPLADLVDSRTEFSVEANPGTVTEGIVRVLSRRGVNRVTLGVQSFDARELALLGRRHGPRHVAEAVGLLRAGGITNLGLDLIYGIPGQTVSSWSATLVRAMELAPAHVSCYALTFEPGTPLRDDLAEGKIAEVDESLQRAFYDAAIQTTAAWGLEHYEISNFARPGMRCRQNLTYWHNESYLGIGPAAASYVGGIRRTNLADLRGYLAALRDGKLPPATSEQLPNRPAMAETLMLGLRLIEGIDRQCFTTRFGIDPVAAFPLSIARYARAGALDVSRKNIRLGREHLFVADTVLADILAES